MADKCEYGWLPLSKAGPRSKIPLSGIPGEPGRHCPMHTALALAKQLGDISTLVVGTAECGYYSRYVMTEPVGRNQELHYVYELDANEVVFGCRTGLIEAIREMDREGAKVILLILTCVPALIGEDMEAVKDELSGEVAAKLFFIDGAHFKYNGYLTGFLDTYDKLGEIYKDSFRDKALYGNKAETISNDSGRKDQSGRQINFYGSLRGKEAQALKNVLLKAGYDLLEIKVENILDKMERLPEGILSLLQDPNQDQLAKKEKNTRISLCRSFHSEDIRNNYRTLRGLLHLEDETAEEFHIDEYKRLKDKEEKAYRVLKGVPFIITVQELLSIPLAAYLAELGMEPKLLGVESFAEEDCFYQERILKKSYDPYLVTITEEENIKEWGEGYPLVSIGHSEAVPEKKRIKNPQVQRIFALLGYERSMALLDCLMELVAMKEEGGEGHGLI